MRPERYLWFRCLAEVPCVGYPGDPARRARLADRDAVPDVHESEFDGERKVSLFWNSPRGITSASPAHRFGLVDVRSESSEQLQERVLSALELPGEIRDYHFAIQLVAETLYKRRRTEPRYLAFVEWLAHLDARLVEAHESLFQWRSAESAGYLAVFAFDFLVRSYEREGYLREALALAERFAQFRPGRDTVGELRARVAQFEAEYA